jgi:hypothetical protein
MANYEGKGTFQSMVAKYGADLWHFSSQNNRTLWSVVLEQNDVASLSSRSQFDLGPYLADRQKGKCHPYLSLHKSLCTAKGSLETQEC